MKIDSSTTCRKLRAMGLTRGLTHSLVDEVDRWVRGSGEEWTVSRLKQLKTCYVIALSGEKPQFDWIANSGFLPNGPFKSLCRSALGWRRKKTVARALFALSLYTQGYASRPTHTQLKKFFSSINPVETETVSRPATPGKVLLRSRLGDPYFTAKAVGWDRLRVGATNVPLGEGSTCKEWDYQRWIPDNARYLTGVLGKELGGSPIFEGIGGLDNLQRISQIGVDWSVMTVSPSRPTTIGRIGFIQEPGYKLRSVANPNRLVQLCLLPLQDYAWGMLRHIPSDCTFNQRAGVDWAQAQLKAGKVVYSIDLTSATDLFPLSYQIDMLRTKGFTSMFVDAFQLAARSEWSLADGQDPVDYGKTFVDKIELSSEAPGSPYETIRKFKAATRVKWTKGQPLGLTPSFGVFAMAHHNLVRECGASDGQYRILGDDIVINNHRVARAYMSRMQELGCEFSPSKTLVSKTVCEFAGQVITRDWFLPSFKWREISDRNFLDIAAVLGPSSRGLLRPKQREVLDVLADVPEALGGLGWNPSGTPASVRISQFEQILLERESRVPIRDVAVFKQELASFFDANDIEHSKLDVSNPVSPTRASSVLNRVRRSINVESMTEVNTPELQKVVSSDPDLSVSAPPGGDPRGPTLLQVWESRLDLDALRKVSSRENATGRSDDALGQGSRPELTIRDELTSPPKSSSVEQSTGTGVPKSDALPLEEDQARTPRSQTTERDLSEDDYLGR